MSFMCTVALEKGSVRNRRDIKEGFCSFENIKLVFGVFHLFSLFVMVTHHTEYTNFIQVYVALYHFIHPAKL